MTPESWQIFVVWVLLAIAVASVLVDRQLMSPAFLFSGSLLTPILIFDFSLSNLTYMLILTAAAAQATAYFGVRLCRSKSHTDSSVADAIGEIARYRIALFVALSIGLVGVVINVGRVLGTLGGDAYSQMSSKDIELAFGANTLTNYLFFTNIAVAALALWLVVADRKLHWRITYLSVAVIALGSLALSGIKSTILFGTAIAWFTLLGARRKHSVLLAIGAAAFGAIAIAMFAYSNLGVILTQEGVATEEVFERLLGAAKAYVYYNYLNLDLEVAFRERYSMGQYTFFLINKLINPGVVGYYDVGEFLVVDRNFNMGTLLREYFVDFGPVGAVLIPLLIGVVSGLVVNRKEAQASLMVSVLYGVLMTSSLFAFFGNQFIRLQFFYVALVILLISYSAAPRWPGSGIPIRGST